MLIFSFASLSYTVIVVIVLINTNRFNVIISTVSIIHVRCKQTRLPYEYRRRRRACSFCIIALIPLYYYITIIIIIISCITNNVTNAIKSITTQDVVANIVIIMLCDYLHLRLCVLQLPFLQSRLVIKVVVIFSYCFLLTYSSTLS